MYSQTEIPSQNPGKPLPLLMQYELDVCLSLIKPIWSTCGSVTDQVVATELPNGGLNPTKSGP